MNVKAVKSQSPHGKAVKKSKAVKFLTKLLVTGRGEGNFEKYKQVQCGKYQCGTLMLTVSRSHSAEGRENEGRENEGREIQISSREGRESVKNTLCLGRVLSIGWLGNRYRNNLETLCDNICENICS